MSKRFHSNSSARKKKLYRQRVYYNLHFFLARGLEKVDGDIFTEDQIRNILYQETGHRFSKRIIYRYLKELEKIHGEAPLEPFYKVDRGWFSRHPTKPYIVNRLTHAEPGPAPRPGQYPPTGETL